jgi:hypothetical protein
MAPLPFIYNDVVPKLLNAEITHYQAICGQSNSPRFSASIERMRDPLVAAAQLRPARPHQSDRPSYPSRNNCPTGTLICHELCLDRFGFPGHDAPWCPFLHPENIKDRQNKQ